MKLSTLSLTLLMSFSAVAGTEPTLYEILMTNTCEVTVLKDFIIRAGEKTSERNSITVKARKKNYSNDRRLAAGRKLKIEFSTAYNIVIADPQIELIALDFETVNISNYERYGDFKISCSPKKVIDI